METKVMNLKNNHKLPAGIVSGLEAFWYDNEKWLANNGQAMRFADAPGAVQRLVANAFLADISGRMYIKQKMQITAFSAGFDAWYRCRIGALDDSPDFVDGNLNADAYNHACSDNLCPHRGRLCSLTPGLRNYEIETIQAIKRGETIEQMSVTLHTSVPGLKSRIFRIREKLGASNTHSMIAKAVEFGI